MADTVLSEAYGRVLSRDFLPLPARELIGAVSLAVQNLMPQLRAHLLGTHNAGAPWDQIEAALRLGLELVDGSTKAPLAMLGELRSRSPDPA